VAQKFAAQVSAFCRETTRQRGCSVSHPWTSWQPKGDPPRRDPSGFPHMPRDPISLTRPSYLNPPQRWTVLDPQWPPVRPIGPYFPRQLTQTHAALLLKIAHSKISRLLRGHLSGFSTERVMHFFAVLGRDVEITVRPAPRSHRQGRISVVTV
jgi:hypothetical protein